MKVDEWWDTCKSRLDPNELLIGVHVHVVHVHVVHCWKGVAGTRVRHTETISNVRIA